MLDRIARRDRVLMDNRLPWDIAPADADGEMTAPAAERRPGRGLVAMMLLTVPLLYPTLKTMGFDGVWFGVVLVVMIELGQLTPPMGLNLFAIHSIAAPAKLGQIAKAPDPQ